MLTMAFTCLARLCLLIITVQTNTKSFVRACCSTAWICRRNARSSTITCRVRLIAWGSELGDGMRYKPGWLRKKRLSPQRTLFRNRAHTCGHGRKRNRPLHVRKRLQTRVFAPLEGGLGMGRVRTWLRMSLFLGYWPRRYFFTAFGKGDDDREWSRGTSAYG